MLRIDKARPDIMLKLAACTNQHCIENLVLTFTRRDFIRLAKVGGTRVCSIIRWAGVIPAGTACDEIAAGFDPFVTFRILKSSGSSRTWPRRQRQRSQKACL